MIGFEPSNFYVCLHFSIFILQIYEINTNKNIQKIQYKIDR